MDKILIRIFKVLSFLIIALGVVLYVILLSNTDAVETDLSVRDQILNPFANLTYITIIIAAIAALVFPLIQLVSTPKSLIRFLIIVAVFVGLGFIAYSMAGNAFSTEDLQRLETSEMESKYVGASLIFTYFIAGLTVLSLIYSGIAGFFKK